MTEAEKREMLEAAARAFWGSEIDDVCTVEWSELDGAIAYTHADNQDHNGCDQAFLWDPLEDDGDALRLAVKLNLHLRPLSFLCPDAHEIVVGVADWDGVHEKANGDPYAATRLAITRAAAEIGRQMQSAEGDKEINQ